MESTCIFNVFTLPNDRCWEHVPCLDGGRGSHGGFYANSSIAKVEACIGLCYGVYIITPRITLENLSCCKGVQLG